MQYDRCRKGLIPWMHTFPVKSDKYETRAPGMLSALLDLNTLSFCVYYVAVLEAIASAVAVSM